MDYREQIHSELRRIARKVPYNRAVIGCANLFQGLSFRLTKLPRGVTSRQVVIKGHRGLPLKVEIFEPENRTEKLPCLIYVHGGAFSYKASAYHKKLASLYAGKAGCRVCFPDYHLAPKYPYPAAYDDVLALYRCVVDRSGEFGVDRGRIGVAGDSAGASIAALICNRCEREGLKPPCVQMLVYPVTDVEMQTDSMKRFSDTPIWNSKNNRRMWSYYGKTLKAEERYDASPMHSRLPQVIPDTYIETAEYDCLHDEGVLYGERLREAGANVEISETRGTIHGYDCAINTKIAAENIEKRILFLRKGFGGGPLA